MRSEIAEAKAIVAGQPEAFTHTGSGTGEIALKSLVIREAARNRFRISRLSEKERSNLGEQQVTVQGTEITHRALVGTLAGCVVAPRVYVRSLEVKPSARSAHAYEGVQITISRKIDDEPDE